MHWASCRNPRPRSGLSLACQRKRKVPEQGCGTPALTISWQPLASAARPSQRPPPAPASEGWRHTDANPHTHPSSLPPGTGDAGHRPEEPRRSPETAAYMHQHGQGPKTRGDLTAAKTPSKRRKFGLLPNVPGTQELAAGPFFTD